MECVELIGRTQISDCDEATYINNREGVHQIHNLTSETVYSLWFDNAKENITALARILTYSRACAHISAPIN